ncbi:SCO family protein [Sphaerimonospora sp. CA-214678]|uniref:SCO family protein n=1 Tax=Sphaerimonospora sp. CA-214678 TaxID=3240029 RepID=UPI003D8D1201
MPRLLAALMLLTALAACGGSTGAADPPVRLIRPSSEFHGTWLQEPLAKPDVTLTDTSGKAFKLRERTAGRLTLLFFGYTHCPDICPTTMADLASALREMPAADRDKISVVFTTTDPGRDTPEVIRSWLASFDSSFVGLTGDFATIQTAAESVGIALERPTPGAGDYEVTHGGQIIAFDGDHQGRLIFSSGTSSAEFTADLRRLLERIPLTAPNPPSAATAPSTSKSPSAAPSASAAVPSSGSGDLRVTDAYVPEPASPDVAAAYFTITNSGGRPAVLSGVRTDVSEMSMLHETMGTKMRHLASVTVPPHSTLTFSRGHYHVMIESLTRRLREGDTVKLTLSFEDGQEITVDAPVMSVGYRPPSPSQG